MMIKLRRLEEKDLDRFLEIRNSSREFLHDNREFRIGETISWFRESERIYYVIESDGVFVGYFRTSKWNLSNGSVWIGADIHPNYRRKGIATKSYNLFMSQLGKMGFTHFLLEVFVFNKAAYELYHKLGFKDMRSNETTRGISVIMEKVI